MTARKSKPVSRTARIFLSSTFRDFGEERDLLVRKVFPGLRARLKDRFVELVDVDLRWGITAEQAERGEVLPICLAEIDRSRPFFVGLLGERYGWVPEKGKYPPELVEQRPWLRKHQGGKSVTELEILHGVLNDPKMAGRALFYFRSAAYAKKKGGDYLPLSPEHRSRQQDLKARIRESGFPVVSGYKDPEALAKRLEKDLWKVLDEMYPADEVPDAFTREGFRHEAYAVPRRRLYLGGEAYIEALDHALTEGKQRVLVEGASGGGKSALIANWLERRGKTHRKELVHVHYLGATAEASASQALVRRLVEAIKRLTESTEEIPSDPQALYDSLSTWLAIAHAYAAKRRTKVLIVLDALNGLRELHDLRWFPEFLPERVQLVASCLPGQVHEALLTKGDWQRVEVKPLDREQAKELFVAYLRRYNKELPKDLLTLALAHPLSTNPLFLRTLAEELRLFGVHEQLKERLDYYLTSKTVDDLFERLLERVEQDCGAKRVAKAMEGIWASRAGLSEHEIQGYANLKPAEWAPIRHALDDSLLESGGRITFAHDYMRLAVSDRYLAGNNTLQDEGQSPEAIKLRRRAHIALAKWFDTRTEEEKAQKQAKGKTSRPRKTPAPKAIPADARSAEEVPWQYQQASDWKALKACLTRRDMFEAMYANRTSEELLSYWLDVEANTRARIEKEYEKAWKVWKPVAIRKETRGLARNLSLLVMGAGKYTSSFLERLCRLSVNIARGQKACAAIVESLNDLADLHLYRATFESAQEICEDALDAAEKGLGPEHILTGTSLNNLAGLLQHKGDYDAAEPLYRRALAIAEKAQGAEHPETGAILNNLAGLIQAKGDYDAAEPLFRRALAIAEKAQGAEHPATGTRLNNIARLLQAKGDYDAAEPLFRRALAIVEKTQGAEHPSAGRCINNLALLLYAEGDYDGAEPLLRRALAIAEKAQGAEHPDTSMCLGNLALLLQDKGDYDAAGPLLRRALAISEKALGAEHPDTGTRLNNLASLLKNKGDYDAAEPLFRRALAIAEKAQGAEHPDTSMRLGSLAVLLHDKGDYDAAEPLYRRALVIAEKAQGAEHPSTGTSLNNLAGLLSLKGDYDAAAPLYRRALAIAEKAQGAEHPQTGTCLNSLANLLQDKGEYDAAEPLYRRALAIAEKAQGAEHPQTGTCLNNLAFLLQAKGDYDAAEPLFRRALAIVEKTQGAEHPSAGTCLNNLALLLYAEGDYDGAEPLLRHALAIAEKAQGAEHPDTGTRLHNLARLLQDKGEYDAAEPLYRRALAIAEKALGAEHPATGTRLNNLAGLLQDKGDYDAAEPLYRRALAIAEKAQGAEHPETGTSLDNLGRLLQDKGDYDAAEPLFHRALAIAEKAQGAEHPETGTSLNNLASLLSLKGEYDAAEPLYRRALAIAEKAQGAEHPETGTRLNNLALLLTDKGEYDAAEPLYRRAMAIAEKSLPPDHPQLTGCLYTLGNFLIDRDHWGEGETLLRRELSLVEGREGRTSTSVAQSLYNLGSRLAAADRFKEAEPLLKQEISIVEELEGERSESLGQSLYNLGNLLADQSRFDEAEIVLRRALVIEQVNLGPEHEDVMGSLSNLGDVLRRAGRYEDAEKELTRAVELASKLNFAGPFFKFAELRIDQKRYDDALVHLQRCLEIRRRNLDPTDEAIGEAVLKLADVYRLMGRDVEAEEILKQLPAENEGLS